MSNHPSHVVHVVQRTSRVVQGANRIRTTVSVGAGPAPAGPAPTTAARRGRAAVQPNFVQPNFFTVSRVHSSYRRFRRAGSRACGTHPYSRTPASVVILRSAATKDLSSCRIRAPVNKKKRPDFSERHEIPQDLNRRPYFRSISL